MLWRMSDRTYLDAFFADIRDDYARYVGAILADATVVPPQLDGRGLIEAFRSALYTHAAWLRDVLEPRDAANFACRLADETVEDGDEALTLEVDAWATTQVPVVIEGFRFSNGRFVPAAEVCTPGSTHLRRGKSGVALPRLMRRVAFRVPADLRLIGLRRIQEIKQALREAIATGDGGFAQVEATLAETDRALEGSGAILGRMIGNHDVTRFASEVAGDAGGDPWDAAPAQPSDDDVYARQRLALGLVLALPGVPVVYYGDEVGLAGAADPDNRRVMPSSTALSDAQVGLLADAQRIAQTRRCLPALRRGARQTLVVTDDTWAFLRDTGDGAPALVVASRAATPIDVRVPPSAALSSGVYSDIVAGDTLQVGAGPSVVALPAAGLRVFVPASHPCLVP
jgi:hypothetical protein